MIKTKNIFYLAVTLCLATYSTCTPQRPNSKLEILSTSSELSVLPLLSETSVSNELNPNTENPLMDTESPVTSTDSVVMVTDSHVIDTDESPYSSDVKVNLNDSNIEENLDEKPLLGTLPVNYNTTTTALFKAPETTTMLPETSLMVSHGIYDLGQKILFKLLNPSKRDIKSEVISPLSIAGVTYLLYLGSAGRTEKELAGLLGLNKGSVTSQKEIHQQFGRLIDSITTDSEINNEDKEFPEFIKNRVHEISVANAIFMNNFFTLRKQYINVVQNVYKSEVESMDFARNGLESKTYIDNWVSNKTRGKIPTILEAPPNANTQIIVVSALYFKALWWEELGVQMIMKQPFYPNGETKESISVDTLIFASELLPYYESAELNCRIIGLRYQKQISTMYIVQPLESNRQSLKDFQIELTAEKLDSLIQNMDYVHVSSLTFPKFHLQNQVDLKLIFRQLGVQSLFTSANLSPTTPNRYEIPIRTNETDDLSYLDIVRRNSRYSSSLAISQIHHKVDLVVNERGTEGGAATAAVVDRISARYMKVNTPFLFVIRQDSTRLPLFYGAIFEPEQD